MSGLFQKTGSRRERTRENILLHPAASTKKQAMRKCAAEVWSMPMAFKDAVHPPAVSPPRPGSEPERERRGSASEASSSPGTGPGRTGRGQDGDRDRTGTGTGSARSVSAGPCRPLPAAARPAPRGPRAAGRADAPLRVSLASARRISRRAKPFSRCAGSDRAAAST